MAKNTEPQRATLPIKSLKKARYNPRKISKKEMQKLVESIKTYGLVQPILVNKDHTIIGGHQRVEACRQLGITEVDVYILDLNTEDEKILNLALNRISGEWDETALYELLNGLAEKNKIALTGFDQKELEKLKWKQGNQINRKLIEDYIVPPFSIFDTKQGYWQKRKAEWNLQLGEILTGREQINASMGKLGEKAANGNLAGVSKFDPVLLEVLYTWYADKGALIIDPFAGSATAGIIASRLGYNFIGTDTWAGQVERNKEKAKSLAEKNCEWYNDSGANIGKYTKGKKIQLMVTDPPYFNLEVYQKGNKDDISNAKTYEEFLKLLEEVLTPTYKLIENGGWAIIKIGNVRDEDGNYYNLVGDTVNIMQKIGFNFYNEAILATSIATAPVRARNSFDKGKKLVKTHQNILFFAKGKEVAINSALRELLLSGLTATAHHDVLIFKK